MTHQDPTQRFSNRVENYARYRPSYPPAAIDCLRDECGLSTGAIVADIGSGTGILTELLLRCGATVCAVEPNDAMRAEAERALSGYANFISINGRAEATTLPDHCVDLITAAQAFHWFDPAPTRREFGRVLRPGAVVALVWNRRAAEAGGFAQAYEAFLDEYAHDYRQVSHVSRFGNIERLFTTGYETRQFDQARLLDYDAVQGGLLSASYAPLPGDTRYEGMLVRLRQLFDTYQQDGVVTLPYVTQLYFGPVERS